MGPSLYKDSLVPHFRDGYCSQACRKCPMKLDRRAGLVHVLLSIETLRVKMAEYEKII